MNRIIWISVLWVMITSGVGIAVGAPGSDDTNAQALVNQLRDITQRARKERAADRWLLQALEDLVAKFDWPWSKEIVKEDFYDGEYQSAPAWEVVSGQFWVDASIGLRSRVEAPTPTQPTGKTQSQNEQNQDVGKAILGALMQEVMRPDASSSKRESSGPRGGGPAEIHLPASITNAFILKASFSTHSPSSERGELEFGILQDKVGDYGYLVTINTGERSSLDLVRVLRGRTSIVERIDMTSDLGVGQRHDLEWRRAPEGTIEVYLDGEKFIQAYDRSFRNPFKRLAIVNRSGDFGVREINILGTR